MPLAANVRKRTVPGTPRRKNAVQTSRRYANITTEYDVCSPAGCIRIQVKSGLNMGSLLTTLAALIFLCLRRFVAPLSGINRPSALVLRAQAATIFVANTCQTPVHPIHAPTPRLLCD